MVPIVLSFLSGFAIVKIEPEEHPLIDVAGPRRQP